MRSDHDISILIQRDQDGFLVSESRFHIHSTGSTRNEAIAAFWAVFAMTGELLAKEDSLSPYMAEQLAYIRAVRAYECQYERKPVAELALPYKPSMMPSLPSPQQKKINHKRSRKGA